MSDEKLQLAVVGISYKTSTVTEREIYQINKKELKQALICFKSIEGVEGVVIVSTCNRLEFYLALKPGVDPFSVLNNFYSVGKIINAKLDKGSFYRYDGIDAAKHLCSVAAGLDSMLTGEYQIQGQIKDAYSLACSEKTAEKILHKLFHAAFRAGKEVRTKTRIGCGSQSLSGIAFKIIQDKLKKEDVITIIGVNQNTKIMAEKLNKSGFSHLLFVNRTLHKAEELAENYNGVAFGLDYIEESLISSKCIFSCTGAPGFILKPDTINRNYSRTKLPKLIIDMAVPRDVNTNGLNREIEVIDIEGLKKYLEDGKKEITSDLPEAERIIKCEAEVFGAWYESQQDLSASMFNEKIELVRSQMLEEARPQISGGELELLDNFSRTLAHRMKSIIIQAIKTSQPENRKI